MNEIVVLLVEDNRSDVILLQEALEQAGICYHLHVVKDGVAAMDFLRRRGSFIHALRPDLIILDLNLPRKDGHEVLAEITDDDVLRHIPIVILTSSTLDKDNVRKFGLPKWHYLIKPVSFNDYVEVVKVIDAFRRGDVCNAEVEEMDV